MFSLKNKVAIVTGASRGIGKAIAIQLSNSGAKVVVSSRKHQECEKVADKIKNMGGKAEVIPCHVGRKDEICNLVKETINKYNSIDILVSNAGTNPAYGPLEKLNDDAFDKVLDVNLKSSIWLVNEASPHLKKNKTSSIIIMSSISALVGTKDIGAYGISKAAEVSLVKNLAVELGPYGIRVNAIAPGLIKTEFSRALWSDKDKLKKQNENTPLQRIGNPEDISGIAHFLASDASSFITGQLIVADGGETITSTLT
tara:strand:+ start:2092 stop:2859 length:768 start_codon:yes stop_codon:yes gene_type:complete